MLDLRSLKIEGVFFQSLAFQFQYYKESEPATFYRETITKPHENINPFTTSPLSS